MKLVSWNVNGRADDALDSQLGALGGAFAGAPPDVVALQEVTRASVSEWRGRLADLGLVHCVDSVGLMSAERKFANLLASRWPLTVIPAAEFEIPFPEKVLSAVICAPYWAVEAHVVHLRPGVSRPEQKMLTFEGIYKRVGRINPIGSPTRGRIWSDWVPRGQAMRARDLVA